MGMPEPGRPGFFDLAGRLRQAITDWFSDLVGSGLQPGLDLLGAAVLATPEVASQGRVRDLWGMSAGVANAALVLLALIGGVIVMSHETLQHRYAAKEIAPRLVVAVVATNASLAVAGQAIGLANAASKGILGGGLTPEAASGQLRGLMTNVLRDGGVFLVLLGVVVAAMVLIVVVVYVARVALLVVLVSAAPLALAGHALPQTEGLARLWWRSLAALLGIQLAQSLTLVASLRIFLTGDGDGMLGFPSGGLVDVVVIICLLWIMIRIPVWAGRVVLDGRRSAVGSVARTYVVAKTVRAVLP